jgi:Flp pilus assembly protein TadG
MAGSGGRRTGVLSRDRADDTGAVAVVVAIFTVILFALLALIVDLGQARDLHRQAEIAADSAALAAAYVLAAAENPSAPSEQDQLDARTAARDYALNNLGLAAATWDGCGPDCLDIDPDRQQVTVRIPTESTVGLTGLTVSAAATATWAGNLPGDCLLCVVDHLWDYSSTGGDLTVTGGDLRVGEILKVVSPYRLTVHAGNALYGILYPWEHDPPVVPPVVDPDYLNEAGLSDFGDPYADQPVSDPWGTLTELGYTPTTIPQVTPDADGTCAVPTGTVGAITAEAAEWCTSFRPGLYLVRPTSTKSDVHLGRAGPVTAENALLIPTCGTWSRPMNCTDVADPADRAGARLDSPRADVTWSGITDSSGDLAAFRGFAVVIDPGNTAVQELGTSSDPTLDITGAVYAPNGDLTVNDRTSVHGQVIAGSELYVGSGMFGCVDDCLTFTAPTTVLPPQEAGQVRLIPRTSG